MRKDQASRSNYNWIGFLDDRTNHCVASPKQSLNNFRLPNKAVNIFPLLTFAFAWSSVIPFAEMSVQGTKLEAKRRQLMFYEIQALATQHQALETEIYTNLWIGTVVEGIMALETKPRLWMMNSSLFWSSLSYYHDDVYCTSPFEERTRKRISPVFFTLWIPLDNCYRRLPSGASAAAIALSGFKRPNVHEKN